MSKHTFALYAPEQTRELKHPGHARLTSPNLTQRLIQVLRVKVGETIIIFDGKGAVVTLAVTKVERARGKEQIEVHVEDIQTWTSLSPQITWWMPLVAKPAFEEALYALAVLGVTTIIPYTCANTQVTWGSPRDYERAQSLIIAAAEQSKSYCLPHLEAVQTLAHLSKPAQETGIFFDAAGSSWNNVCASLEGQPHLTICSGPEADLREEEKKRFVREEGWHTVSLTPTILKAEHAVWVGGGMVRSLL